MICPLYFGCYAYAYRKYDRFSESILNLQYMNNYLMPRAYLFYPYFKKASSHYWPVYIVKHFLGGTN